MAQTTAICFVGCVLLLAGCQTGHRTWKAEHAQAARAAEQAVYVPTERSTEVVNPVLSDLEGPHPVEQYIPFALQRNPEIQAARKQVESLAHQVPIAASLEDPMWNVTVQPEQIQTAAGQQEMSLAVNQKVPWFGKRNTRANVAEAQTNVARARLAATELATIAHVKRAYYELYFIRRAITVTQQEQRLLVDIRDVANARYRSGGTSQQDVLRAELEISNQQTELIRLQQQLVSSQARLATLLHVAPQTRLLPLDELPPEDVPKNLEFLQACAIRARPELHSKLAEIERDQSALELAHLEYKPDLTMGLSWIDVASTGLSPVANGRDAFLLNVGGNLPVYRMRLSASVRSAEAKMVATAREYDALRDGTLEQVTDLFARARSQHDMLLLFRDDILPRARQTLEVSSQAYNGGQVDFLQLIDNWRQLLRYEITHQRIEADLRQTLAELERVVGGFAG